MRKEKIEELEYLINECKTIKKELLEGVTPSFLKTRTYKCSLANGKTMVRDELIKGSTKGNAAIIMPVTKDNNVILTVESRPMTKESVAIGFPAGYVEEFEDPLMAAYRELLEETGYKAGNMIYIDDGYQDNGVGSSINYLYLAKNVFKVSEPQLDGSEYVRHMIVTLDELYELYDQGRIKSLSNKLLLEKSKKYLRGE